MIAAFGYLVYYVLYNNFTAPAKDLQPSPPYQRPQPHYIPDDTLKIDNNNTWKSE